jgi:hypothetical protein
MGRLSSEDLKEEAMTLTPSSSCKWVPLRL